MKSFRKSMLLKAVMVFLGVFFLYSCETDDKIDELENKNSAIVLDCDYFKQDRVLVDNPDAPVDYIITCNMAVRANIRIEPGVVIEFEENAGIDIDDFNISSASLSAVGTADKPIVFRGAKKEAGFWRGIMFNSNSASNKLIHTRVEDAGGMRFNSNGDLGAVHVYAGGRLTMENTTVSNSKTYGLNAVYGDSEMTLNNNKFTNNDAPVIIDPSYVGLINNTNDYKGNAHDYIMVKPYTAPISKDFTWHKVNVPYQVLSTSVKQLRVMALLTIQAGVVIEFGSEVFLKIDENGGGLKAVGTASDPIIFTGVSKVAQGWKGINIESKHAQNEIAFAEIHYSGMNAPQGNVWLWYDSFLHIHDVKFKNIHGCGINHRLASGGVMNPNLQIGDNITVDSGGCLERSW